MHEGAIDVATLSGEFDLQATVESGQSYLWDRADGRMYERSAARGGDAWYHTVVPAADARSSEPEVVRASQRDGELRWEASTPEAPAHLRRLLRLEDDLAAIREETPDLPLLRRAWEAFPGMRLVRDPPFGCLVSFICSAQMRVARIHDMQRRLAREYGATVEFDGRTYHAYPSPAALAAADERTLRDLRLGYRAPYVVRTAELVADGEDPETARSLPYEAAREWLTRFVGVGQKVADCVCLFSLGFLEAVPLDTWIRKTVAEHFPDCERGSYEETSRAIRERFGGRYAGYVQTYVFHHLRGGGE